MKIVITGHTAGIGKAFAEQLASRGHEIVGISRRVGENIRRTEHTANLIQPCDMFINNAQSLYAQTELLYAVWQRWQGQEKWIWNISTQMTQQPVDVEIKTIGYIESSKYRNQKVALENASVQLQAKSQWPKISVIRPGQVYTQEGLHDKTNSSDVEEWVKMIIDIFTKNKNFHISDITLVHTNKFLNI